MLRFLAIVYAVLFSASSIAATVLTPESGSYAYPMEGVARLYSANFGEMRANHFHSGVDIKSDGVQGKRVVAAADGYVSRLSISPYGYGLSIYVTHNNGTTTQYGHLSKFRDDIEEFAQSERYRLRQHSINLFLAATKFPVKRGDLIAYSGNTGGSSGPHLHFEVRETKEQRPLNPVTIGVIQPLDKIKPLFKQLYYIETETVDGVTYSKGLSRYEVEQTSDGVYRITGDRVLWAGREGHFVVAACDKKNSVHNTFGIYSVEFRQSGELIYKHQQDGFLFSQTRYCNSVSYFPLQRKTSVSHYRLRRQEGLPESMLKYVKDDGVVRLKAGEQHDMSIKVTDDMNNSSTLNFVVRGKDDQDCFKANIYPSACIARAKVSTTYTGDGVVVTVPSGTLYESIPYSVKRSAAALNKNTTGVEVYSPRYDLFDYNTPLHRAMDVSIEATLTEQQAKRSVMVYVSENGWQSAIRGRYKDGRFTASTRMCGGFFVAADLVSPTVSTTVTDGADLSRSRSISFTVKDNFSGVASFEATIDGEWVALDLDGSKLTHIFKNSPNGELHRLELKVKDLVGNESILSREFRR